MITKLQKIGGFSYRDNDHTCFYQLIILLMIFVNSFLEIISC